MKPFKILKDIPVPKRIGVGKPRSPETQACYEALSKLNVKECLTASSRLHSHFQSAMRIVCGSSNKKFITRHINPRELRVWRVPDNTVLVNRRRPLPNQHKEGVVTFVVK